MGIHGATICVIGVSNLLTKSPGPSKYSRGLGLMSCLQCFGPRV